MTKRLRAAQANEQLTRALLTLASQGMRTHGSQPETHHYWTNEYREETQILARLHLRLPALPSRQRLTARPVRCHRDPTHPRTPDRHR
jgi:hypothetical protein